jgi:hypothetical protein
MVAEPASGRTAPDSPPRSVSNPVATIDLGPSIIIAQTVRTLAALIEAGLVPTRSGTMQPKSKHLTPSPHPRAAGFWEWRR